MLFFEKYSIIQVLFLFNRIRMAKLVYFHKRSFPSLGHNPKLKSIVKKLVFLFNKNIKIETLKADKINEYNWEANKDAVKICEAMTSEIETSAIYKSILKIVKDENIIKYFKGRLVNDISAKILFSQVAEGLIREQGNNIYLVPADSDSIRMQKELLGEDVFHTHVIKGIFIVNWLGSFSYKIWSLAVFFFLPAAFVILNLKKLTFKKIKKGSYDIAMPVIWGFHEGPIIINGINCCHDDMYLYCKGIAPGQIIHIFSHWRNAPEIEERYRKIMNKNGFHYIDNFCYKMNITFITIVLRIQLKIIFESFSKFFYFQDKSNYITYSHRVIYRMLNKYLEFENVNYKIELMRTDYEPSHVVETILCNQNNRMTVGIQHGADAGPYVLNTLCYVHFNKYCIFSRRHLELYAPFWEKLNLENTGNPRTDYLFELSNSHSLTKEVKSRFESIYGKHDKIVLILFPSPLEYHISRKWDEIYETLRDLKSINIDCIVFLRFRSEADLDNSNVRRFKNLQRCDSRFVIDLANFNTYELMVISDVVIGASHSSGIIEAASVGKKAFSFDYMGTAKYTLSKYGKDLILNKKDDVLRIFRDLKSDYSGYDCNWDSLKQEYNYYCDGKSLKRIQEVILNMISADSNKVN